MNERDRQSGGASYHGSVRVLSAYWTGFGCIALLMDEDGNTWEEFEDAGR